MSVSLTQPPATDRTTLPLLADRDRYQACRWNLSDDAAKRDYWLGLFRNHLESLLAEAVREAVHRGGDEAEATQRAAQVRDGFHAFLDKLAADPAALGRPLFIMDLCLKREQLLRDAGFDDPYRLAKHRENETALELLPDVLAQLDALPAERRDQAVVEGIFAGNIFDLGATQTVERFTEQRVDFHSVLSELKPRPWLIDDLDAWLARLKGPPHRLALLFVDNAGPDIAIGMFSLARHLLQRGTDVILAANTHPSLNDVTAAELEELVTQAAARDATLGEAWGSGRLRVMANGNGAPLIDMTRLSEDFVASIAAEPVDLVVIEGMGRAIESNFDARFTCDALKVAMIKDRGVADAIGGELYDLVFRFQPA